MSEIIDCENGLILDASYIERLRLPPEQRDTLIKGDWDCPLPADTEQAISAAAQEVNDSQYLEAYRVTAQEIEGRISYWGWARTKGYYKKEIRNIIGCFAMAHSHLVYSDAHIDAILDGLGC